MSIYWHLKSSLRCNKTAISKRAFLLEGLAVGVKTASLVNSMTEFREMSRSGYLYSLTGGKILKTARVDALRHGKPYY